MPPSSTPFIRVAALHKAYATRAGPLHALADISFEMQEGKFVAVVGPSA